VAAEYARLAYPGGVEPGLAPPVELSRERLVPRHVLIVALETAPARYYPLADDPSLPVFHAMAQRSIVSDRHYAPSPYTVRAIFSIVTGTYARGGENLSHFGPFATDSLAAVLARQGYETWFIDSYKIDWEASHDHRKLWQDVGFAELSDASQDEGISDKSFEAIAARERSSFDQALRAIVEAEQRGRKAVVTVATSIGHYEWKTRVEDRGLSNADKVHGLAAFFDGLFGELLSSLERHGLEDDVLIVVTGDHGLRYRAEFESLDEKPEHGDAEFNVPFMLYAPGILDHQVRLPHVTSHVDITPTLLGLVGLEGEPWMHHGTHVLDGRLAGRITFMLNTGLSPVDGFHWNGTHYTVNGVTGRVAARPDRHAPAAQGVDPEVLPDEVVRSILERANRVIEATACGFLRRAS
jgi:arylsulfatase A-like enzyme